MTINYEPSWGENIHTTLKTCMKISNRRQTEVTFTFNGIEMQVKPDQDVDTLYSSWQQQCDERSKSYADSVEGKSAQRKQKNALATKQKEMDDLMKNLPTWDNKVLVNWLMSYAIVADYVGVKHDKHLVVSTLNELGFVKDMWVGFEGEWTLGHELEWIVGQVLNCLDKFDAPHPVTLSFCEKWLAKATTAAE